MIRVAVFLAVVAQMPLVAWSQQPAATPPAQRVADSYYLRRQAKLAVAAADHGASAVPGAPDQTSAAVEQTSGAVSGGPSLVGASGMGADPYYAQRQAAAAASAVRAAQTHYVDAAPQQSTASEEVELPQQALNSDGCVSNGCGPDGCIPNGCGPDGGNVDGSAEQCGSEAYPGHCWLLSGTMCAAVCDVPTTNVLWNEIYSCRCMWADVDYLGWWVKGNHVPPLVTTSPQGTPQAQAGVLGQPGTSILFGDQRVDDQFRSGGRLTIGGWLVGDVWAIEGNYYALNTANTNFSAASVFSAGPTNDPILARPFFDPTLNGGAGAQHQLLVAFPNFNTGGTIVNLDGTVNVHASNTIQSSGVQLKRLVGVDLMKDHRMFLTGGYRFFRMEEGLQIADTITPAGGTFPPGTQLAHFDSFGTKNNFQGGDIGLFSDLRRGRWVLETQGKIAFGNMQEIVNIDGQTKVNTGTSLAGYPGGLLTQVSNMGVYRRNQFAMIPELNVKLGFQITQRLRATAGYNFTYVTRVARPGNEIDFVVAVPPSPGAPQPVQRPMYLNNPTDLWLQGLTAGFEYRW